jgi:hypothetical protein
VFESPLGLLALLAIPAIVGLHYFRRRFRPQVVSAVFLWVDDDRTPLSGRKRERLRNSWSLWSELAAALLLALMLAGPRGCEGRSGTHLVVIIDGSPIRRDESREDPGQAAQVLRRPGLEWAGV